MTDPKDQHIALLEQKLKRMEQQVQEMSRRVQFLERENNRRKSDIGQIASAINRRG